MSEINWGEYALADSINYPFKDQKDWYWTINPITSGMELDYSKFLNHRRIKRHSDGTIEEFPAVGPEIAHRQIALCFGGTNIPRGKEKEGEDGFKPILGEKATLSQIEKILAIMPPEMITEIWKAVGKSYPYWGPVDMGNDESEEDSDSPK
jgi:hypothetical protein